MNDAGTMIKLHIEYLSTYDDIDLVKFIIIPNHIHAIIIVDHGTTQGSSPTISKYIRRFKTITTIKYIDGVKAGIYSSFDKAIWQKSYYDHIICDENEYLRIWQYIDENPLKWQDDEYFKL